MCLMTSICECGTFSKLNPLPKGRIVVFAGKGLLSVISPPPSLLSRCDRGHGEAEGDHGVARSAKKSGLSLVAHTRGRLPHPAHARLGGGEVP